MAVRESTVGRDSGVSVVAPLSKLRLSNTNRFGIVVSLVLASHVASVKLNAPSGTEILKPLGSWSSASLVVDTRAARRAGSSRRDVGETRGDAGPAEQRGHAAWQQTAEEAALLPQQVGQGRHSAPGGRLLPAEDVHDERSDQCHQGGRRPGADA